AQVAVGVDAGPLFATVVGAVETAFLGFDEGIDAATIARRNRYSATSPRTRRQAVIFSLRLGKWGFLVEDANRAWADSLPGVAPVVGTPDPAAPPAAGQAPRRSARLPQGRKQDARVGEVEADVDRSGVGIFLEDLRPRFAAVGRAIDATLR